MPRIDWQRKAEDLIHHIVLKKSLTNTFFLLDSKNKGGYYAPRVEKSGQKWAFQNSLAQTFKVLLELLSTSRRVPSSETLC